MNFGFISLFIASCHRILLLLESPDIGLPNQINSFSANWQTCKLPVWIHRPSLPVFHSPSHFSSPGGCGWDTSPKASFRTPKTSMMPSINTTIPLIKIQMPTTNILVITLISTTKVSSAIFSRSHTLMAIIYKASKRPGMMLSRFSNNPSAAYYNLY